MSDYSEYVDKANGVGGGKHAKTGGKHAAGSGDGGGENAGCMVVAPLPVVLAATLLSAAVHWIRRR